jgi:hypothetical protein
MIIKTIPMKQVEGAEEKAAEVLRLVAEAYRLRAKDLEAGVNASGLEGKIVGIKSRIALNELSALALDYIHKDPSLNALWLDHAMRRSEEVEVVADCIARLFWVFQMLPKVAVRQSDCQDGSWT